MLNLPELPQKYYLDHFKEFLSLLTQQFSHLMEPSHKAFMQDFQQLTEDAQCTYVRMVNRKGHIFFKKDFVYAEINYIQDAFQELAVKEFIRSVAENDLLSYLSLLSKAELMKKLLQREIPFDKKLSKLELLDLARSQQWQLSDIPEAEREALVVQGKTDELTYLLFLYFGKIQTNLSLYTLRDLGIKQVNKKQEFKPRFEKKESALVDFFYAHLHYSYFQDPDRVVKSDPQLWPTCADKTIQKKKEELLLLLSEHARREGNLELACERLKGCEFHPAREKRCRLLYQLEKKDLCLEELHKLLDEPDCDEEYLFAEDFLARKFHNRKVSLLTETLRNATRILIDESFYRKPEAGVIQELTQEGYQCWHSENYLWSSFFGILFWHELFEGESQTHNQFDQTPHDLVTGLFYANHEVAIHQKLKLLDAPENFFHYLEELCQQKADEKNGIFGWHPDLIPMLTALVQAAAPSSLQQMMIYLAQDYLNRATGFPDLLAIKDRSVRFYEIKAEGDSLKSSQLKQIVNLRKAGLEVDVLQVAYNVNPDQTYVVVDLETTGGSPGYHRITEVGAVKIKNGEVIEEFQSLVNPERSIPFNIQQLTGITNEMVRNAPKFSEIAESLASFCQNTIFVAHNVAFDYGFLQHEYERLEQKFTMPYICTKAWARKHFPGLESYSLKNLTQHFSIQLTQHHRALCDAQAAAQILMRINEKRRDQTKV